MGSTNPSPRKIALRLSLICVLALVVTTVVILLRQGPAPRAEDAPGVATSSEGPEAHETTEAGAGIVGPEPTPSGSGPLTETEAPGRVAERTVTQLLDSSTRALSAVDSDARGGLADIEQVAVGSALGEAAAQAQEFEVEGWTLVGTPEVVWTRVIAARSSAAELFVRACIDSSSVSIRDSNGNRMSEHKSAPRSLNLYVLKRQDGAWKVAEHSFPPRPDC